jgi:hypothetical protein
MEAVSLGLQQKRGQSSQLEKASGEQHWPLVKWRLCLLGFSRREDRAPNLRKPAGNSTGLLFNRGHVSWVSAEKRTELPT